MELHQQYMSTKEEMIASSFYFLWEEDIAQEKH